MTDRMRVDGRGVLERRSWVGGGGRGFFEGGEVVVLLADEVRKDELLLGGRWNERRV